MKMRAADEVMSEAMQTLFLNKQELSSVNKKILFGLLSKKPEKHIRKMLGGRRAEDVSRTLAGGGGGTNQKTPMFFDHSESATVYDHGDPQQRN
jgi:hypothetical protein